MILTHNEINAALAAGHIVVEPLAPGAVGTNSIDLRLGLHILTYKNAILDAKIEPQYEIGTIPESGFVLVPDRLYLASTLEYTETHHHAPILEGKSSVGRLGLHIHVSACFGDVGFCGHWTLELHCVQPIRIYPGMPIAQLAYHAVSSLPDTNYMERRGSSYTEAREARPVASRLWKKFI
jgi:dCTP deaminase